jgi:hypothetical protein
MNANTTSHIGLLLGWMLAVTALAGAPPNPPFPAAVALDGQTFKRYEERLASLRAEVQRMEGLLAEDAGKPRQPRKRFAELIEKTRKKSPRSRTRWRCIAPRRQSRTTPRAEWLAAKRDGTQPRANQCDASRFPSAPGELTSLSRTRG